MSLEEKLSTSAVQRNGVRNWDNHTSVLVAHQYAIAAYRLESGDIPEQPAGSGDQAMFNVPFSALDFALGNNLAGGLGLLDWFNSGLGEQNALRYHFNRELGYLANPNSHYFKVVEGNGEPTPETLRSLWDEAYKLFKSTKDQNGECRVWGWTQELQYRRTYPKDVPGRYKLILYKCPHPLYSDKIQRVIVQAWANPAEGIELIASVTSQCWLPAPTKKQFVDVRECAGVIANEQRHHVPFAKGWMELLVTISDEDKSNLHVVGKFADREHRLRAPELTPEYRAFLSQLSD